MTKLTPCVHIRYDEFPELLFGELENGFVYFNASDYLLARGNPEIQSVEDFNSKFFFWYNAMASVYHIPSDEMIYSSVGGKIIIEESMSLLFVAYTDACFGSYIMERISEMLINGIVLSDTYLMRNLITRFTKEDLITQWPKDEEK